MKLILRMLLVINCGLLVLGFTGCKKPTFTCTSYDVDYMVCTQGTDTVRYLVSGFDDHQAPTLAYYQNSGYTCVRVPYFMAGKISFDNVGESEVKELERQGFVCYQNR